MGEVVVLGFGVSGQAAARLLLREGNRVRVLDRDPDVVARSDARELAELGVVFDCGPHRAGQLGDARLVVVSPGVPNDAAPLVEARQRGIEILGEMELAARRAKGRLLGITGSNGKSTTVTLAAAALAASGLSVQAGGNLGRPLSELVLESDHPDAIHCLEVSSFQCETLEQARFEVATILNVSADHLDRYESLDAYAAAKLRLLDRVPDSGTVVLPAGDERLGEASRGRARVAWFGAGELPGRGVALDGDVLVSTLHGSREELVRTAELWSPAAHDVANAMAAAATCLCAGGTGAGFAAAARAFTGLPHRRQRVRTGDGPRFFDDSKATNVAAAAASVAGSSEGVVAIVGGRHKGGSFEQLVEALELRAGRAVLIGEAADLLAAALDGRVPAVRAASLEEAVTVAAALATPGGEVVLAPACASFDMFEGYEHRGRSFQAVVLERFGRSP